MIVRSNGAGSLLQWRAYRRSRYGQTTVACRLQRRPFGVGEAHRAKRAPFSAAIRYVVSCFALRATADAGLFSSRASPAANFPSDTIFSSSRSPDVN